METVNTREGSQSGDPKNDGSLSFDNTKIAFAGKTNGELKQAYWLFKMIDSPFMMGFGKYATLVSLKLHLPIGGIIRKTIFKQFCGGETIEQCAVTTRKLDALNVGTILDYSVEGKNSEKEFDGTVAEILKTIEVSRGNDHIPFCVFKPTGLCKNELLEKVSSGKPLSTEDAAAYQRLRARIDLICGKAAEAGTPIFMDAEETWMQQAVDDLAMEMMEKYNQSHAIVYNTLQMYRHDRIAHMTAKFAEASAKGFIYAIKLVRGAYMEKERERAAEKGYPDPIQPNKAATDRDYDAAVAFCLDHLDRMAFCAGTHNEESAQFLVDEIARRGLDRKDKRIYFAQLFGMSDHISFNLSNAGYRVAKYVPYGPVKEVMPYLIRRAEENTSVAGQTGRELSLIKKEIARRSRVSSRERGS